MDRVSGSTPLTHGHEALRSYLLELYGYSRERKAWKDSPPEGRAEQDPPLPPDRPNSPKKRDRYVLSNIIRCDGLQVHALVYDLRKPHQSPHARSPIPNIEKAFPTRESIDGHFHDKPNTVIVGMDPGETVTATFCALDPQVPVQVKSLTVKRAALHAPILDFRRQMQDKKANSITDMESRLPSSKVESIQGCEDRMRAIFDSYDDLSGFHTSMEFKRMTWERSCVCVYPSCQRWIYRLGAHNLALIGQEWIDRLSRPPALRRTPPQPSFTNLTVPKEQYPFISNSSPARSR